MGSRTGANLRRGCWGRALATQKKKKKDKEKKEGVSEGASRKNTQKSGK